MSFPANLKNVHFIGIGGYGMSALALILLQQGFTVSGSDLQESTLTANLAGKGATIMIGHREANLGTAELVIYSTAVPSRNPELVEAGYRGLIIWHRSELLAALFNDAYGIAITGTHGKTTTTAMVALLLEAGGLDPTAVIGGVLPAYGSNARLGRSQYLVAEADESDSSFTRYFPKLALVTGLEADHLDHYNNNHAGLIEAYSTFLANIDPSGTALLCADDPYLGELAIQPDLQVFYYGLMDREDPQTGPPDSSRPQKSPGNGPDYYAGNINLKKRGSTFDFYYRDSLRAAAVNLNVPGLHNVCNATGALALADRLGLDPAACSGVLSDFTGVGRRFEVIGTVNDITVIDDYAHHPTEIRATIKAARPNCRRLICIFQPHRYTRTAYFFDEFSRAFAEADLLLLHSVFSAGEVPIPGITSDILADQIRYYSNIPVFQCDNLYMLEEQVLNIVRPGDLVITMGAGDITKIAPDILARLQEKESRA